PSMCLIAGSDPATDHTSTPDNGVAGVAIGGCEQQVMHGYYYLTSPKINLSTTGTVYLEFWRWLNSDYPPYMTNDIEVFNGATWIAVWTQPSDSTPIQDSAWTYFAYDVTAYKNANFQVRFGFKIESIGVFQVGSWNIDDVRLVSGVACP